MLHLRSSNGYQNIFSINVYQNQFGSSINAINWTSNTQYLRTSGINQSGLNLAYYINLIDQNTQKEYFSILGQTEYISNFPRSQQFYIYLDGGKDSFGQLLDYHINLSSTGLYDYHVYWGRNGATSITDNRIVAMVHSGMALVHNDNFVNDYFQNSTNGVEELTIPTTIAYNG
tara:strand:+ start:630 stop:1148 length:519 start_codon:yes stop_codon:yes gene_type:complete